MPNADATADTNRRREPRRRVRQDGLLFFPDGRTKRRCHVFDISPSGARLKVDGWRYLPDTFSVQIENGPVRLAEIRSRKMGILGVRFFTEEELQAVAAE